MLKGKVALISGGSRGIGRAIAVTFARNGADVAVLFAGNAEKAEDTCRAARAFGVRALPLQCDVSSFEESEAAMQRVMQEFGSIQILVNNAGINRDKLAVQMRAEDFEQVLATNLTGAFNLIRHTYSGFVRQRSGRIINITSVAGMTGNAGQCNYSAAKAGMIGLTKSIAKELAGRGVTCNAIAPGLIQTDMMQNMPEAAREALLQSIPMKRAGKPEEIADIALFLASQSAGYITGTVIPVDGGLSM